MKVVLFCNQPYAFSILHPISVELTNRGFDFIWFLTSNLSLKFPYKKSSTTFSIDDLIAFQADAIFVPGNDVPHYLCGLKVQIFHGLSQKKGHYKVREYFDLYLTAGPHFTDFFNGLLQNRPDTFVYETGWSKLDDLFKADGQTSQNKENLLTKYHAKHIVVYAPTFSPSLTSANDLFDTIDEIARMSDVLVICKFHDLMDRNIVAKYCQNINVVVSNEPNIISVLQLSDVMISDTSSVVSEFLFLNKPVITFKSSAKNIAWMNFTRPKDVLDELKKILGGHDEMSIDRRKFTEFFHPYKDGHSSKRVLDVVERHLETNGVPKKRAIPWHRKIKMYNKYGYRLK